MEGGGEGASNIQVSVPEAGEEYNESKNNIKLLLK